MLDPTPIWRKDDVDWFAWTNFETRPHNSYDKFCRSRTRGITNLLILRGPSPQPTQDGRLSFASSLQPQGATCLLSQQKTNANSHRSTTQGEFEISTQKNKKLGGRSHNHTTKTFAAKQEYERKNKHGRCRRQKLHRNDNLANLVQSKHTCQKPLLQPPQHAQTKEWKKIKDTKINPRSDQSLDNTNKKQGRGEDSEAPRAQERIGIKKNEK